MLGSEAELVGQAPATKPAAKPPVKQRLLRARHRDLQLLRPLLAYPQRHVHGAVSGHQVPVFGGPCRRQFAAAAGGHTGLSAAGGGINAA